ncbi:hypothetical protein DICPUDRAFT_82549 [Dictyostelium purpureum]|uniref:Uncharacterized protein n=1 Tax=Dictyostelium purpureum TaxID=5786 RepID=F0ZWV2_DICPU|nr:uncharacterized protein DICPUDRAFT_82549 [Dictyostelium purpureum]EGC31588.1 hypothetical protein DICPUDRAFT_82549 [Dictyostelium purpureum]|eukprot:XP_003291899.1 hypothetical protein DICPUDRAFT_82549 [Dictyostelium purpureum]
MTLNKNNRVISNSIYLPKHLQKEIIIFYCDRINRDYQIFHSQIQKEINEQKKVIKLVIALSLVCKEFLKIVSKNIIVSIDYLNSIDLFYLNNSGIGYNSNNNNNGNNNSFFYRLNNNKVHILKIFYCAESLKFYVYDRNDSKLYFTKEMINNYIRGFQNLKVLLIRNSISEIIPFNSSFLIDIENTIKSFSNNKNSLKIKLYTFQIDSDTSFQRICFLYLDLKCSSDCLVVQDCQNKNIAILSVLLLIPSLKSLRIINYGFENSFPFLELTGLISSSHNFLQNLINSFKNYQSTHQFQQLLNYVKKFKNDNNFINLNSSKFPQYNYLTNIRNYQLEYRDGHEITKSMYYLYLVLKNSCSLESLLFGFCMKSLVYNLSSQSERKQFKLLDCPCGSNMNNSKDFEASFRYFFEEVTHLFKVQSNLEKITIHFNCSISNNSSNSYNHSKKPTKTFLYLFGKLFSSIPNITTICLYDIKCQLLIDSILSNNKSIKNVYIYSRESIHLNSFISVVNKYNQLKLFIVQSIPIHLINNNIENLNNTINNNNDHSNGILFLYDRDIKKRDFKFKMPAYLYFKGTIHNDYSPYLNIGILFLTLAIFRYHK